MTQEPRRDRWPASEQMAQTRFGAGKSASCRPQCGVCAVPLSSALVDVWSRKVVAWDMAEVDNCNALPLARLPKPGIRQQG